ncbi:hypothetical protein [Flavobacterium sp.]|uniref:hypothetical protein n=1 Tax=Flavobacterium sp. TaxID=239 RepID=UPI00374C975E
MIVYYYDNNGFFLFSAEKSQDIRFEYTETEINNSLISNKWNGLQWIEGLTIEELEKLNNDEKLKFIYNNEFEINLKDDFSLWSNFYLIGNAKINTFGDKSNIQWKTPSGEIAIEEKPVYTRYKQGSGLLAKLFLKRELEIIFFRKNGTFVTFVTPTKLYNENDRILSDKKSRSNIIEMTRKNTGGYIYQKNMIAGTPQNISLELPEALGLFEKLQKQITLYREEREHVPLVTLLQNTTATETLKQETINFIINQVNINFY